VVPPGVAGAGRPLQAVARAWLHRRRRDAVQPHADAERRADDRSLYPVRRLRDGYGLAITTAMQCDVNGISWLYADLLPEIGIELLTMAINPLRGATAEADPGAFWWEGPAGNRVLPGTASTTCGGGALPSSATGASSDQSLPPILAKLEADPTYPYDFLYAQSTHRSGSTTAADARMPDFVRDWNAQGRTPRVAFTDAGGVQPAAAGGGSRRRRRRCVGTGSTGGRTGWRRAHTRRGSAGRPRAASDGRADRELAAERGGVALERGARRPRLRAGGRSTTSTHGARSPVSRRRVSTWTRGQWSRKANYG
jgi:hypothetical protein